MNAVCGQRDDDKELKQIFKNSTLKFKWHFFNFKFCINCVGPNNIAVGKESQS